MAGTSVRADTKHVHLARLEFQCKAVDACKVPGLTHRVTAGTRHSVQAPNCPPADVDALLASERFPQTRRQPHIQASRCVFPRSSGLSGVTSSRCEDSRTDRSCTRYYGRKTSAALGTRSGAYLAPGHLHQPRAAERVCLFCLPSLVLAAKCMHRLTRRFFLVSSTATGRMCWRCGDRSG